MDGLFVYIQLNVPLLGALLHSCLVVIVPYVWV